jgi:hypothetical protein
VSNERGLADYARGDLDFVNFRRLAFRVAVRAVAIDRTPVRTPLRSDIRWPWPTTRAGNHAAVKR